MRNPLMVIIVVLLVLALLGSPVLHFAPAGWGWYGSGGLGTVAIVLIILLVLGII